MQRHPSALKHQSISRNSLFDSGSQILIIISSLLTGIFVARALGDSGRGVYILTTSFALGLLFSFFNIGFERIASVTSAKSPEDTGKILCSLFIVTSALLLLFAIFSGNVFNAIQLLLPSIAESHLVFLLLGIAFQPLYFGCQGIMTGLGEVRLRAQWDLATNLTQHLLIILILLVPDRSNIEETIFLLIASYYLTMLAGSLLLSGLILRYKSPFGLPNKELLREFGRLGSWLYIGNIGSTFSQKIDQFFVARLEPTLALFGIYTLATSLANRTRIVPQALVRSAWSQVCSLPEKDASLLVARCFRQTFYISIAFLLLAAIFAPLIPVIYGTAFAPAILPCLIYLTGRAFHNASWTLAMWFTGHRAQPKTTVIANWFVLPVQLLLLLLAMQTGTLEAIAFSTLLTYFFLLMTFMYFFLRDQKYIVMRDLFIIQSGDIQSWKKLFRKKK